MVDEARDSLVKEQMGVVLRYVNKKGCVIERFLAVVHVSDTTAESLKKAIDALFMKHGLSLSKLRGQGYDGASNMRGEFKGLKSLILQENPHAMYVHCFSHQLQLVLVAVAEDNIIVSELFAYVTMIVNTSGASCKRRDQLRMLQHEKIVAELENGEILTGRGKNQETNLTRPVDTRWGSHYLTLLRLCSMWSSVQEVLINVVNDASSSANRELNPHVRPVEEGVTWLECAEIQPLHLPVQEGVIHLQCPDLHPQHLSVAQGVTELHCAERSTSAGGLSALSSTAVSHV
ncbi:uncharacterized protein LOC124942398 [Impatiens glandulifera]|uniref:uncharacterized protein LOC124942398 n=1 Tax=Impatiens glandulifera TaxID=253017 RepID=UPI001FB0CBEB|nr:uncharacterized protein LOC124942398 [Impatiens glandulifera]